MAQEVSLAKVDIFQNDSAVFRDVFAIALGVVITIGDNSPHQWNAPFSVARLRA